LGGGDGDPYAHAAITSWYCPNVPFGIFEYDRYLYPVGADLSMNFDSPFPYLLTCAAGWMNSISHYHLFIFFQILLIVFSSYLLSTTFLKQELWQFAYVLFIWWSGYYFSKVTAHPTLLSNIWGFQILLYSFVTINWGQKKNVLLRAFLVGLAFSGTAHNLSLLFLPLIALGIQSLVNSKLKLKSLAPGIFLFGIGFVVTYVFFFWPMILGSLKPQSIQWNFNMTYKDSELFSVFLPYETNLLYSWFKVEPFLKLEQYNPIDIILFLSSILFFVSGRYRKNKNSNWLLGVAGFSFIYSLGALITVAQMWEFKFPLNNFLSSIPPFSVTRTPNRFACITGMVVIYWGFQYLSQYFSENKKTAYCLIAWALLAGPGLNQSLLVPHTKYQNLLPKVALEKIKNFPDDTNVFNIPNIIAADPTQNFLALFHNKKISGGYLNYVVYTKKYQDYYLKNPFLSKIMCNNNTLELEKNDTAIHQYFVENKFKSIIINKGILLGPQCAFLLPWIRHLTTRPWIEVLQENTQFVVLNVVDI
jgi:hypothetical protein